MRGPLTPIRNCGGYGTNSESVFDPEQFFKLGLGAQKVSHQFFQHLAKRRVGKVASVKNSPSREREDSLEMIE